MTRRDMMLKNGQLIPVPEKCYNEVKQVLADKINL